VTDPAAKRFKVAKGKMLVVAPGEEPEVREVVLIHDAINESVGIQMIGDSEIKGWCFFVPLSSFQATIERGTPVDKVKPPV
jgi:hypothetical protein